MTLYIKKKFQLLPKQANHSPNTKNIARKKGEVISDTIHHLILPTELRKAEVKFFNVCKLNRPQTPLYNNENALREDPGYFCPTVKRARNH